MLISVMGIQFNNFQLLYDDKKSKRLVIGTTGNTKILETIFLHCTYTCIISTVVNTLVYIIPFRSDSYNTINLDHSIC